MRRLRSGFIALLLVYSVAHFFQAGFGGLRPPAAGRCAGDFVAAFGAPFVARYNPGLYAQLGAWGKEERLWNYGPMFHGATLPLTFLRSTGAVCVVWAVMNLAFVVIAAVVLFRLVFGDPRAYSGLILALYAALWLNFYPLLEALRQGNIEVFELAVTVVGVACLAAGRPAGAGRRGRDAEGGALLGVAALTKFLPLVFVPYLVLKRRWRALVAAAVTMALITILAQMVLDWRRSLTLVQMRPAATAQACEAEPWCARSRRIVLNPSSHNQGLTSLVARFYTRFPEGLAGTDRAALARADETRTTAAIRLATIVVVVAFAAVFLIARRRDAPAEELALLAAFMIFVPQWNNDYYQVFLLPGLALALNDVVRAPGVVPVAVLAVFYAATGSTVVPASLLDRLFDLGDYGLHRLIQNLSLPAWANIAMLGWLGWRYATGLEGVASSRTS